MERAPLTENIFEVPRYRQKFAAYLDLLARNWFNYENIYQQSAKHHNLISPYINQATGDKAFIGETAWFNFNEFENGWQGLAQFAGQRSQFILENLTPSLK